MYNVYIVESCLLVVIFTFVFYIILKIPKVKALRYFIFLICLLLLSGLYLSKQFNLALAENAFKGLAFILCIAYFAIFAPEIRSEVFSLIETMQRLKQMKKYEKFLYDLIDTLYTIARKNYEGIIVVERNTDVAPYVTGGLKLNAPLSSQLIEMFLNSNFPLENRTVIIKRGIISLICCQLPQTKESSYQKLFSTHQKEAVGITEKTDAVAIILDGGGRLSMAYKGKLEFNITKYEFEEKIKKELAKVRF